MTQAASQGHEKQAESHKTVLITLLFMDIVGSTKLKRKLGEVEGVRLIQQHHEMVRGILREFAGANEISAAGDGLFITFVKPSDAVCFALRLQAHLRAELSTEPRFVRDRVGIHLGEVVVSSDQLKPSDFLGIQVDTAQRVTSLGQADQILCTPVVFDNARQILHGQEIKGLGPLKWMNHGKYRLKDIDDPVEICEVGERDRGVLAPPPDGPGGQRHVKREDEVVLGWRPGAEDAIPKTEWILKQKLGAGGFGETWKAEHIRTKEVRAFKFCFTPDLVTGLQREKELFERLKVKTQAHVPFVKLYEVSLDHPPFYLEMEYVEGKDLRKWLEDEKAAGHRTSLETKLEIAAQVAEALALAHSEEVVHNDVKPSNILVCSKSEDEARPVSIRLADFGIGQLLSPEDLGRSGETAGKTEASSSSYRGSVSYSAPELRDEGGKPSPQSDLYSLGVVLYQLYLDDMRRAPRLADWEKHVKDPIIRGDLRRLLEGEATRRPHDGNLVAKDLRQYVQRRGRRRLRAWLASILGVLAVFCACYYGYLELQHHWAQKAALAQAKQEELLREYCDTIAEAQDRIAVGSLTRGEALLNECSEHLRGWEWRRLKLLCQPDLMVLKSRSGPMSCVSVSPDGRWIAGGSSEGAVMLWDLATGREMRSLKGHTSRVSFVAFTSDGRKILTGAMDETARIWDCPGGKELKTIKGHSGSNRVIVSADGKRFASASNDGVVQIGDTDTGKEPRLLAAQPGQAWSLVFSPDGKRLALGGKGTFKIWAADSGQELMTYQGETQPAQTVRAMAFSSDGTQLLFGGGDRTVKVVDIAGQKVVRSLSGHYGQVWSLALSPDGTRIAAGSDDNVLIVWDAHSGKEVARHNLITLLGYSGPVFSVAFSPKGDKIAFGSTGGTAGPAVIILDVDSPRCRMLSLQGLPAESTINAFDVSCDGKLFLTGISDGTARLWDGQTSTELATLQGHSKPVLCVGFSPDGKWAVSGSDDTTLRIWDVGAGRELRKLEGHGGSVRCVEVSPDGKLLASGSDDTTLRIWNAQTGDLLKTLKGHSQSLTSVCFSPDGTRLASGGGNLQNLEEAGELKIWNVQTGAELIGLKGHAGGVLSLAFSPNGMRLASGSWDKTVKVWDVFFPHKGTEAASMKDGHSDAVWAVTFSPDGTRVVSGSGDESVRVWDAQSGREVLALKGHAHAIRMPGPPEAKEERSYCVNYVGFSRDGRRITSAGCDGTVMLWEAE